MKNDKLQSRDVMPPHLECHEGPDVMVVVGGQVFHEYSYSLRCWSGYFDAAFRSGMKESKSKRFEFPNKDPQEWELLRSLFVPFPREWVGVNNYHILYPWFELLGSSPGLHECDKVVYNISDVAQKKMKEEYFGELVTAIEICITWNREDAKNKAVECLRKLLEEEKLSIHIGKEIPRILSLLIQDGDTFRSLRETLWMGVEKYLTEDDDDDTATRGHFDEDKMKSLMENPLLNQFILMKVQMLNAEKALTTRSVGWSFPEEPRHDPEALAQARAVIAQARAEREAAGISFGLPAPGPFGMPP